VARIGIRIEDDVVVTRGEPEVITAAAPTDPDEIEALMAAWKSGPKAKAGDGTTKDAKNAKGSKSKKANFVERGK
jgi:hypothetical protein